jgi:hypothetical protein
MKKQFCVMRSLTSKSFFLDIVIVLFKNDICFQISNRPWAVARNCETITTLIIDQKLRDFDTKLD